MAIFHASLRVLSRSQGNSAVAAAAYRAGVGLHDVRLGIVQDYSRKKGVEAVFNLAPPAAPTWATDDAKLWNAAEAAERRKNARVARELIIGLPHELTSVSRCELAQAVGQALVERYAVAVQVAVHAPDQKGDDRNHHAHLLMTTRTVTCAGVGAKVRVLDDKVTGPQEVEWMRQRVAELTNAALAHAGISERVDHRTLTRQAEAAEASGDWVRATLLTREPTRHVGRAGMALTRRGKSHPRFERNARIVESNRAGLEDFLRQVQAEGRLMPPASDAVLLPAVVTEPTEIVMELGALPRATGWDAARQNAEMRLMRAQLRAVRKTANEYIKGLHAMPTAHTFIPLLDPAQVDLKRQRERMHRELTELRSVAQQRRLAYKRAQQAREACQREVDEADTTQPSRWRLGERQRWEKVRKVRWAKLRAAVAIEQLARENADGPAMKALRAQSRALRAEVERLDIALAPKLKVRAHLHQSPSQTPTSPKM